MESTLTQGVGGIDQRRTGMGPTQVCAQKWASDTERKNGDDFEQSERTFLKTICPIYQ